MSGVTWRAVPAKFNTGMCEMKSKSEVLWCILGHWFRTGLAEMRGVAWRVVPAKLKTGMCEMKSYGGKNRWNFCDLLFPRFQIWLMF